MIRTTIYVILIAVICVQTVTKLFVSYDRIINKTVKIITQNNILKLCK